MNLTEKELAFLYDLYVAPDWGERFAELIDEHVKLPGEGGRVLYVEAGTGEHALALKSRAVEGVGFVCVDESGERLKLAREKAAALAGVGAGVEFRVARLDALEYEDGRFDLVLGDASLVAPERVPEMLSEMSRVAARGGRVGLNVVTASSFGEFFSVYWEALMNAAPDEDSRVVERLITQLPSVAEVEALAAREGLEAVESWTRKEEFDFKSGAEFVGSPFVRNFLLEGWTEDISDDETRERVINEAARIIDEEGEFSLSVKATIVVGRKAG